MCRLVLLTAESLRSHSIALNHRYKWKTSVKKIGLEGRERTALALAVLRFCLWHLMQPAMMILGVEVFWDGLGQISIGQYQWLPVLEIAPVFLCRSL